MSLTMSCVKLYSQNLNYVSLPLYWRMSNFYENEYGSLPLRLYVTLKAQPTSAEEWVCQPASMCLCQPR